MATRNCRRTSRCRRGRPSGCRPSASSAWESNMPEYLSPGVYVEEVATGPRPIEGVGTSTVGFVGRTERGPTQPRLVASWLEYVRWFGGYLDQTASYLPFAVKGFFDNGGKRAFI